MPMLKDFEHWRNHAVDFFKRLCGHRRAMHDQTKVALDELRSRHDALATHVRKVEERLAVLETGTTERIDSCHYESSVTGNRQRGRSPSVPERILKAQLEAIHKRSPSPGPDALRALAAYS